MNSITKILVGIIILLSTQLAAQETLQSVTNNGSSTTKMIRHSNSMGMQFKQNNILNNDFNAIQIGQYGGSSQFLRFVPYSIGTSTYDWSHDFYYDFTNTNWGVDGGFDIRGILDVDGEIQLKNPHETVKSYFNSDDENAKFIFTYFNTGGAELEFQHDGDVILAQAGNVGIGVTSPKSLLSVASSITGNANYNDIGIGNATNNRGIQIFSGSNSHSGISFHDTNITSTSRTDYDGGIYYAHGANEFQIWGNKQRRLTIDADGDVGIGTTSPNEMLSLNDGNIKIDNVDGKGIKIFQEDSHRFGQIILQKGWGTGSGTPNTLLIEAGNTYGINYKQRILFKTADTERFVIEHDGNVGIGTTNPDEKLTVKGTIHSEEVKVDLNVPAPDYVFESDYELRTLKETKEYIIKNKHLPEIPSASEIGENGIDLGDMNMRLLKKIEELTLYQIQLMEEMEAMKKELKELKNQ